MAHKQIQPAEFMKMYESGGLDDAVVIDVREPVEWEYYHLEGMELIPVNDIPDRLQDIPEDLPVYVVCAHGVRSEAVCRYLSNQGYRNLVNVEGGMAALSSFRGFQYD